LFIKCIHCGRCYIYWSWHPKSLSKATPMTFSLFNFRFLLLSTKFWCVSSFIFVHLCLFGIKYQFIDRYVFNSFFFTYTHGSFLNFPDWVLCLLYFACIGFQNLVWKSIHQILKVIWKKCFSNYRISKSGWQSIRFWNSI